MLCEPLAAGEASPLEGIPRERGAPQRAAGDEPNAHPTGSAAACWRATERGGIDECRTRGREHRSFHAWPELPDDGRDGARLRFLATTCVHGSVKDYQVTWREAEGRTHAKTANFKVCVT